MVYIPVLHGGSQRKTGEQEEEDREKECCHHT